jgi:peroxiredoxin
LDTRRSALRSDLEGDPNKVSAVLRASALSHRFHSQVLRQHWHYAGVGTLRFFVHPFTAGEPTGYDCPVMEQPACKDSKTAASIGARSLATVAIIAGLWLSVSAQQDSTFSTASGGKLNLSSLRGKVVVLVFSSVQDPQCRDEFKALDFLIDKYRDAEVALYWVSISPANAMNSDQLTAACGSPGSVPLLGDPNQTAFRRLGSKVPRVPTVVILNKQGQMSGQPRGGFSPDPDFVDNLSATIDGLLAAKGTPQ